MKTLLNFLFLTCVMSLTLITQAQQRLTVIDDPVSSAITGSIDRLTPSVTGIGLDIQLVDMAASKLAAGSNNIGLRVYTSNLSPSYGVHAITPADGDISIFGSNESICGLAGRFDGFTHINRRLVPEVCDLSLKLRYQWEGVFPNYPRPSAVPIPELGGMALHYQDLEDSPMFGQQLVAGEGVSLIPSFRPCSSEPPYDIPVLNVMNYTEREVEFDPLKKGCPTCYVDVLASNFIQMQPLCLQFCDQVSPGLVTNDLQERTRQSILDSFYAIQVEHYEETETPHYQVDYATLPEGIQLNMGDKTGLSHGDWLNHLTLGIKALQQEQDVTKEKMEQLEKENAELKDRLAAIEKQLSKADVATPDLNARAKEEVFYLKQNRPNPFDGTTIIDYKAPKTAQSVQLAITDLTGKLIQKLDAGKNTVGQFTIESKGLTAGTYNYTLVVDGEILMTKQMMIMK